MAELKITAIIPPTLRRVPATNIEFILSRRCRKMWARTSVMMGELAMRGETAVTGALLSARNTAVTAKP